MADPARYRVTVKTSFAAYNEMFTPGTIYWVTPEIYNGQLGDGSNFKDHCETAQPENPSS